jgi:hypothetical protein
VIEIVIPLASIATLAGFDDHIALHATVATHIVSLFPGTNRQLEKRLKVYVQDALVLLDEVVAFLEFTIWNGDKVEKKVILGRIFQCEIAVLSVM